MTGHDPLCVAPTAGAIYCICDRLANARADERERIARAIDGMDRIRYSVEGYWTKRVSDALDAAAAIARLGGVT